MNDILRGDLAEILHSFTAVGEPIAILLTFMEALFFFFPLIAFVAFNTAAFGLVKGFLLSWIGSVVGTWCLYWIIRSFPNPKLIQKLTNHPKFTHFQGKFNEHDMFYTAILFLLPFFPNSLMTAIAAINKMAFKKFAISSSLGIAGCFFLISYGVSSFTSFFTNPIQLVGFVILLAAYYLISKKVSAA